MKSEKKKPFKNLLCVLLNYKTFPTTDYDIFVRSKGINKKMRGKERERVRKGEKGLAI